MFFTANTYAKQMEEIKSIFQLNVVSRRQKNLGLPSMVGRKKVSFFNYIKLRLLNKISNCQKKKKISSGGKEVLIKAMGLCANIQKEIARFLWETKRNHRGIHWSR